MSSPGSATAFAPSGFFALARTAAAVRHPDGHVPSAGNDSADCSPCPQSARPSSSPRRPWPDGWSVWHREPDSEAGRKVEQALARYVARMAGRATPFGLFAGCSVGTVGRATRLTVGDPARHTRLDMDYVVALADALGRDPQLQPALRFTPNSSLYRVAGRARYLEVRRQDRGWSHHRAALEVPDYLDAVLARAAGGATPAELAGALLDHDPEATEAEAAEYVAELIEQQVLVSELAPAVTGPEPIHGLIERLRQLPAGAAVAERLAWVRDELAALDAGGPGASPDRYRADRRSAGRVAGGGGPVAAVPGRSGAPGRRRDPRGERRRRDRPRGGPAPPTDAAAGRRPAGRLPPGVHGPLRRHPGHPRGAAGRGTGRRDRRRVRRRRDGRGVVAAGRAGPLAPGRAAASPGGRARPTCSAA